MEGATERGGVQEAPWEVKEKMDKLKKGNSAKFLDPREVSLATGIPLSTLYSYIRKGYIRALKNPFGRKTLIYEEEISKLETLATIYEAKNKRKKKGEGE